MSARKRTRRPDVPVVSVAGTVTAAEDGRPLAGATVTYWFAPENEYERRDSMRSKLARDSHPLIHVPPVITDRRGRFRFPAIPFWPGAPRKIGAELAGRFPSSRTVEFAREGQRLRVDLRLGRAAVLRGTARMADGEPVAGVEVSYFGGFQIRRIGRGQRWEDRLHPCHRFPTVPVSAVTGPDGRYELGPFPRGVSFQPDVSAPWGLARETPAVTIPEDAHEARLDLVLDPAGQVQVAMVRGRGPLPKDAHLDVRSADRPRKSGARFHFEDLGSWRQSEWTAHFPAMRPGRAILVLRASGPRGPGGERRVPLTVRAGAVTRVRAALPPALSPRPWKEDVPDHFSPRRLRAAMRGEPVAAIAGVVRDAATGKPIRGALVSDVWRPSHEHYGGHRTRHDAFPALEAAPVRTDARGRFRIERVPFHAGKARKVLFEADGYWTTARVYEFARVGEVRRFEVRLRRAGVLRGVVRDLDGRPRPGTDLWAYVESKTADDWEARHRALCTDTSSVSVNATTGPDGAFALSPLPFDRWFRVCPSNGKWNESPHLALSLPPEHPVARRDFVLDPGGTLRIEILQPRGVHATRVDFELRRSDGEFEFSSGWQPGLEPGPWSRTRSMTHAGIAPGDFRLVVRPEGLLGPARPLRVRIRRDWTTTVRVRLRKPG